MNKFKIGDKVYFYKDTKQHKLGTVTSVSIVGDPWVEWDASGSIPYYSWQIVPSDYQDFQDKIEDRLQ